jgi:PTH1 family peptidyl-tRNA hydrolase
MNLSGQAVARAARKAGVKSDQILVCHDELDLAFGRVRLKAGGGTAGHNGLKSVEASLRSRDFLRLRIGIGRPPAGVDPADFVLKPFLPDEREPISEAVDQGVDAVELLLDEGLDAAQRVLHSW